MKKGGKKREEQSPLLPVSVDDDQELDDKDVEIEWGWCNLVTSVISLCCCQCFGLIATVASILAYVDHNTKKYDRSLKKRKVAWGFGITAIVLGMLAILFLVLCGVATAFWNFGDYMVLIQGIIANRTINSTWLEL